MSGEFFCLNNNEEYIERCGEIFRTNMNSIVVHCTMCEDKFRDFEIFVTHINEEHSGLVVQTVADDDASRENKEDLNESFDPFEFMEKDLLNLFDLNYFDDTLTNIDENILEKELQTFCESLTSNKAISETSKPTEIREVRTCNVQKSIRERPHKCEICGLGFKDKYNMHHHIKRHSSERQYACSECNKRFYTGYELKIHTNVHTKVRPFLCHDCGRSFRTNALLLNHKKRHTNQRDFKCSKCKKTFFENRNLQEHMLIHSNERHFSCSECDAVFLLQKSLLRHKRTHQNKKTIKCELCNAVFVQNRAYNTHMKRKHKNDEI